LFDEGGLGDHAADTARSPESEKRNNNMDKEDDEAADLGIDGKRNGLWRVGTD